MRTLAFIEILKSGRLIYAILFMLITFSFFVYKFFFKYKPNLFNFLKHNLKRYYRYVFYFKDYFKDTAIYLYKRYYRFSFFYFFFNKLFRTPIEMFIKLTGKELLRTIFKHVYDIAFSLVIMLSLSYANQLVFKLPKYILEAFYIFANIFPFDDFVISISNWISYYRKEIIKFKSPITRRQLNPIFVFIFVILHFILCVIVVNIYLVLCIFPLFFVIPAFSFFYWNFYLFLFTLRYIQFLFFFKLFNIFCKAQIIVFTKASLLFVPMSTLVFKKCKYWSSDEEESLHEDYISKKEIKPYISESTFFYDTPEFPTMVEKQQFLLRNPPTINRLLLHEGILKNTQDFFAHKNFVQKWIQNTPFKKKKIPFLFTSSDTQSGVTEKSFIKLFWVNDLVVNKTFVNRLNYSVVDSIDNTMCSDAMSFTPTHQSIVYCESTAYTSSFLNSNTFSVTSHLKISFRNSLISPWVDVDYTQYIKQFVLNRVFNKLKFSNLNGISHTSQHIETGAGSRSAVYKVYTPDFIKQSTNEALNNPFKAEDIFKLHATSLLSKKGRTVALGKSTDIVLLLKSLRTLYQTLECFSKPTTFAFEKFYKISSLFDDKKENLVFDNLQQSVITKKFTEFCVTSPFSFLPYSHIHHISYETRPDRFYLLPTSIDMIVRPFLNRLLFKFSKQLSLSTFFLTSRETQVSVDKEVQKNRVSGSILAKLEYILYKFFSNQKTNSLSSTVNTKLETATNTANFKITHFNFLNVLQKSNRLLDLLFTCETVFSSLDFSIFGSKILSLVYKPCYSSFNKLLLYFTKQGNLATLEICALSLFYNFFNSTKLNLINYTGTLSSEIYVILIWRAMLKSVQASFLYFLPKIFLEQSYNRLLSTDLSIKKIGGLDILNRYTFGVLNTYTNKFLHPFTAVYNRNLLSFNLYNLLNETHSSSTFRNSFGNVVTQNSVNFFVDKKISKFIWWWLDHAPMLRSDYAIMGFSHSVGSFSFVSDKFISPLLVESAAGATSIEFLNFASLSYDPTGSLGAATILPAERFMFSKHISDIHTGYNETFPVSDFITQNVFRRDLKKLAGDDFEAAEHLRKEHSKKIIHHYDLPLVQFEGEEIKVSSFRDRVEKPPFSEFNGVFARPMWSRYVLYDDFVDYDGPTLPGFEPGTGSGLPYRYWGWSYYQVFLIKFFRAFSYIKFNRARSYYRTAGFSPMAPLLLFLKKHKTLMFPKTKRHYKKIKTNKRKLIYRNLPKILKNKTFKSLSVKFFKKTFGKKGSRHLLLNNQNVFDFFGGFETQQRVLFRSLRNLFFDTQVKKNLTKGSVYRKYALKHSSVDFHNLNKIVSKPIKFNIYTTMHPALSNFFKKKHIFQPAKNNNPEIFVKKIDNLYNKKKDGFEYSPFVKKAVKLLTKTSKTPSVFNFKLKKNKLHKNPLVGKKVFNFSNLLKAAGLLNKYNKRIKRRLFRIRSCSTSGKLASMLTRIPTVNVPAGCIPQKGKHTALRETFALGFSQKLYEDLRPDFKSRGVLTRRRNSTQNYFSKQTEFIDLRNALFGVLHTEKNKNVLETQFFLNNFRKTDFLKKIIKFKLNPGMIFSAYSSKRFKFLLVYLLFFIKLIKQKQAYHKFKAYKDIFLFRSLNAKKNFMYSEHSFEESFFSLLCQRTPLVCNTVLVKPVSRSMFFNKNILQFSLRPKSFVGVNFASSTTANLIFFNYVFLGQGVFFNNYVVNPKSFPRATEALSATLRFLNTKLRLIHTTLEIGGLFPFWESDSIFPIRLPGMERFNRVVPWGIKNFRFLTSYKKIPFFLNWPFKVSKELSTNYEKKKFKIIESKEVRILRNLFFQNKLAFLNLTLSTLVPWSRVEKSSKIQTVRNSLLVEKFTNVFFRNSIQNAATSILLQGKPNFHFNQMCSVYHKQFNIGPYFNWLFDTSEVLVYEHWKKNFEVSHFNLSFQKLRYLQQYKKKFIDFGLQYKFSPLLFDLRLQLPIKAFTRIQQFAQRNQLQRYKKKRITYNNYRKNIRHPIILDTFIDSRTPSAGLSCYYNETKEKTYHVLKSITNKKRSIFYKREKLFKHRISSSMFKNKVRVFKDFSFQSAFKRSVAAAIRFYDLSNSTTFNILPLYAEMPLPLTTSFYNFNKTLTPKFLLKLDSKKKNLYGIDNIRDYTDITSFVTKYYSKELNVLSKNSPRVTELTKQKSNFERPGFKLSFISELITRKFLLNQKKTPLWFINWAQTEGLLLLHRYVAYKKHSFITLPQAQHAPVPNSSGIEKIAAAFDLALEKSLLHTALHESFYKPLFPTLREYSFLPPASRVNLFKTTSVDFLHQQNTVNKLKNLPTTYDLLLSKAVRSFFVTQGILREINSPRWHKTEYCRSNRFGWLLPIWSAKTFKRVNLLNFVTLKKNTDIKNCLSLNSLHKQLTIDTADGYFYFLLLKENSTLKKNSISTFNKNPKLAYSHTTRPFALLNQRAFSMNYKGFKSIFSKGDLAQFKNLLRWGVKEQKYFKRRRNKRILRLVQPRKFRQVREKLVLGYKRFRKRKFYVDQRGLWGDTRYPYIKNKKILHSMLITFLFFIHTICYQRVLRRLSGSWNTTKKSLTRSTIVCDPHLQKPESYYFDYKFIGDSNQTSSFSKKFPDNLMYNAAVSGSHLVKRYIRRQHLESFFMTEDELDERKLTPEEREFQYQKILFEERLKRSLYKFDEMRFMVYLTAQRKFLPPKKKRFKYSSKKFRYITPRQRYPLPYTLPRAARFQYFFEFRQFLKENQSKAHYFTLVNNSMASRLRSSRWLRKGQLFYKKNLLLKATSRLKHNPHGLNLIVGKKEISKKNLVDNFHDIDSKKTLANVTINNRSLENSKKKSIQLLHTTNNRTSSSRLLLLQNAISHPSFSMLGLEPWEPKRPLKFLKYTNKFYFERSSRHSRSIVSMPTLFSNKHLTVSFERFRHDDPRSVNKRIRYSQRYSRNRQIAKERDTDEEFDQDFELTRNQKHTFSSARDEHSYAEKSFSYSLTHLYGLHQPVFDLLVLNNLSQSLATNELYAIHKNPWWIQRQEFRRSNMHFTKVDSISSFRKGGRWGIFLRKIDPNRPKQAMEAYYHNPYGWFTKWMNDRYVGGASSEEYEAKVNFSNARMSRYRHFFRLHQQITTRITGSRQHRSNKSRSFWRDPVILREVSLPFTFSYFRENPVFSDPVLPDKTSMLGQNPTPYLRDLSLVSFDYLFPVTTPVTAGVVKLDSESSENENPFYSNQIDSEFQNSRLELLENVFLINKLKERKTSIKTLEFSDVASICYSDLNFLTTNDITDCIEFYETKLIQGGFKLKFCHTLFSYHRYKDQHPWEFPNTMFPRRHSMGYSDFSALWKFRISWVKNTLPTDNFLKIAQRVEPTRYVTRTRRKAFSLFFPIDESRNNNFTNKRALTAFQVTKLATLFNYGSSQALFIRRKSSPVNPTGVPWVDSELSQNYPLRKLQHSRIISHDNVSGNSVDFYPPETRNHRQLISFTWFFVSRSWDTIRTYGFRNYTNYVFFWLVPFERLYQMPFYIVNTHTTVLIAALEDFYTNHLTTLLLVFFLLILLLLFLLIFGVSFTTY